MPESNRALAAGSARYCQVGTSAGQLRYAFSRAEFVGATITISALILNNLYQRVVLLRPVIDHAPASDPSSAREDTVTGKAAGVRSPSGSP